SWHAVRPEGRRRVPIACRRRALGRAGWFLGSCCALALSNRLRHLGQSAPRRDAAERLERGCTTCGPVARLPRAATGIQKLDEDSTLLLIFNAWHDVVEFTLPRSELDADDRCQPLGRGAEEG